VKLILTIWRNMLPLSSGLKSHLACYLLHASFSLGLFFGSEDWGVMLLGNIGRLSTEHTALYPRRRNSCVTADEDCHTVVCCRFLTMRNKLRRSFRLPSWCSPWSDIEDLWNLDYSVSWLIFHLFSRTHQTHSSTTAENIDWGCLTNGYWRV
jgi:hypothetical protein